jgi:hypothetical protein
MDFGGLHKLCRKKQYRAKTAKASDGDSRSQSSQIKNEFTALT